jgi:putative endonuclease
MNGYVYILKSLKNNRFYIGSTNNVEKRLIEHNSGKSIYTSESGPWGLVFRQQFDTLTIARKMEYWLKKQKDKNFVLRIVKEGIIKKSIR